MKIKKEQQLTDKNSVNELKKKESTKIVQKLIEKKRVVNQWNCD